MKSTYPLAISVCLCLPLIGCQPNPDPLGAALPEPIERRVPKPIYSGDEVARWQEVQAFLAERYKDFRIVQTTQTYIGDIIDWIDPASLPGSDEEPPPPISAAELALVEGTEPQLTELDMYPELRGPEGTIPITRPTFEPYIRGWTNALSLGEFLSGQIPGQPDGQTRLYAGYISPVDNKGAAGIFNAFAGDVEEDTFSLMELAVACDGPNKETTLELIGMAASRDKRNFGDEVLRLQVEFFSEGNVLRSEVGGWHGLVMGFVPVVGAPYGPGIALVPISTVGGAQYASAFKILQSEKGDWWLAHNGQWLGYYPAKYFDLINTKACKAAWYGEVYDATPKDWTSADMGSGQFADTGFNNASYISNLTYYDTLGQAYPPAAVGAMGPVDAACYTSSSILADALGVPYFFLGGPGGNAPGCN